MLRDATAPSGSEEAPEVTGEPTSGGLAWVASPGDKRIAVLIPFAPWIVVTEDRGIGFGLVIQAECQIAFDKTLQRFGDMRRRLIVVDNALESIHRSQVLTTFEVVPTDFHLLARQMVAGKIEFELSIACVLTVGKTPHHIIERF